MQRAFRNRRRSRSLAIGIMTCLLTTPSMITAQGPGAFMTPAPEIEIEMPPPTPEAHELWRYFYTSSAFAARQDSKLPRDAYWSLLERWAERPGVGEVELLAELELRMLRAGSCMPREQRKTLANLARNDPGAVLSAMFFHVSTWRHHLDHRRFLLVDSDLKRIREWTKDHSKSRGSTPITRSHAVTLLTYLAEVLWQSPYAEFLSRAEDVLDDAVDLDPDHVAARYLRSMVTEKLGKYGETLRDMEYLSRKLPRRGDITLRLAIQLVRRGQNERAAKLFEGLTTEDGTAEPWVRAVAFQEWARLELALENPDRAREILRKAQADDPANARFAFMEIEAARRVAQKPSASAHEILRDWSSDFGPTPRLRYLLGPLDELAANRHRLTEASRRSAPLLAAALSRPEREELAVTSKCEGAWKWLVPDNEKALTRPSPPAPLAPRRPQASASREVPAPGRKVDQATPSILHEAAPTEESFDGEVYIDPDTGEALVIHDSTDLELQPIYVTPTRFGRRVLDLRRDEITVLDDGHPQEIVTFAGGGIPFTATLLLDASASMTGSRLDLALDGVRAFVAAMESDDRARLVMAADRLRGVSPFLSVNAASTDAVIDRLNESTAEGGTALFDHLFLTLDALEPELGRKVVIVLSDGYDLMSAVPASAVRDAVRRSQTQVYWVRLREGAGADDDSIVPPTNWRTIGETLLELYHLERAVAVSGGRVVDVRGPDEVAGAFTEIMNELREQLVIGYYPDPAYDDGRWREIKVKSSRLGVRLRHGEGYFDE